MFSQLTSFANKLSLDNLQQEKDDNEKPISAPPVENSEEGGGVSSLFGGLQEVVSRSAKYTTSKTTSVEIESLSAVEISKLEKKISELNDEVAVKSKDLQIARNEISDLENTIKAEKKANKDLSNKYQVLCETSASDTRKISTLSENIITLTENLRIETLKCDELHQKVLLLSKQDTAIASDAVVTPIKSAKKVIKKKKTPSQEESTNNTEISSPIKDSSEYNASTVEQMLNDVRMKHEEREKQLLQEIDSLTKSNSQHAILATEHDKLLSDSTRDYKSLLDENSDLNEKISTLSSELSEKMKEVVSLTEVIQSKEEKIVEVSGKLSTLTEKAKDYVKKFAEAKNTISTLEEEKTKLSETLQQSAQQRESELLSLRLRLEAQDSLNNTQKSTTQDLNDRNHEAQKEIQRLKTSLQESNINIDVLQRDIRDSDKIIKDLQNQLVKSEQDFESLKSKHEDALKKIERSKADEVLDLQQVISTKESLLVKAAQDLDSISREKSIGDAALKGLDDYKKKAQAALKKSSETAAALTAEISSLNTEVENLQKDNKSLVLKCDTLELNVREKQSVIDKQGSVIDSMKLAEEEYEKKISDIVNHHASLHESERNTQHSQESIIVDDLKQDDDVPSPKANLLETKIDASNETEYTQIEAAVAESISPNIDQEPAQLKKHSLGARSSSFNENPLEISDGLHLPLQIPDKLMFISEMSQQLENARNQVQDCLAERDKVQKQLQDEIVEKNKINDKLEDCLAFLERTKKLQSGPESAINMEYLKNCVYHYMISTTVSERLRLYPVIGTILKFTPVEMSRLIDCPLHIDEIAASIEIAGNSWNNITGSIQGLFR